MADDISNDKPWTPDPDIVGVLTQWVQWYDALNGVDPVKLMPALLALRDHWRHHAINLPLNHAAKLQDVFDLITEPESSKTIQASHQPTPLGFPDIMGWYRRQTKAA